MLTSVNMQQYTDIIRSKQLFVQIHLMILAHFLVCIRQHFLQNSPFNSPRKQETQLCAIFGSTSLAGFYISTACFMAAQSFTQRSISATYKNYTFTDGKPSPDGDLSDRQLTWLERTSPLNGNTPLRHNIYLKSSSGKTEAQWLAVCFALSAVPHSVIKHH